MKKFLLILLVLVSFTPADSQISQLLMSENFTGYSNGNANGQGGVYPWTATGNSNYVQVANSTPLYYPNYTSGTQYVNVTQKADYANFIPPFFYYPDDPYKKFIASTQVSIGTNTSFFMSFVVRVNDVNATASTGSARPTMALRTVNGDNLANFYLADNGTNLKIGINKDGSQDGVYSAANYSFGTTYLIVLRYDLAIGSSSNDKMYLWVNPSLASEPSTAAANVAITSGNDSNFGGNINWLELFQQQYSATASIDAIKLAYARNYSNNSLAAWNALSPIGAPLPVNFGEIKGTEKDGGIQLDWSVYTELDVTHYEIERSTDGVSFSTVGMVTAQRADGTLYYHWYDAAPGSGNNFYRIKNVDIDNKSSYSPVVRVSLEKASGGVSVYPNPVTGKHISFQAGNLQQGEYKIEISTMAGQQVYSKQLRHAGGPLTQSLQLPSGIKTGIYNIRLTGTACTAARLFLVQ